MDILFHAFSNSHQSPLPTLQEEDDRTHSILARREAERHFRLYRDSHVSISKAEGHLHLHSKNVVTGSVIINHSLKSKQCQR